MPKNVRLYGVVAESIVDGPGLRHVIFTQGCLHACHGCHNPQSHALDGGYVENVDRLLTPILENPLLSGVTFSGGEPFLQAQALCILAKKLKEKNIHLLIYTGYTLEALQKKAQQDRHIACLLELCDMLIDGEYRESLFHEYLVFRGSSNQRIWKKDAIGSFFIDS